MGTMKLNGWKRIGIVASVVWAIGGYFHEFHSVYDGALETYSTINTHCTERANDGASTTKDECDREFELSLNETYHDAREAGIFAALVPIPLAWGAVYFALFLGRWVKRGFVPASAAAEATTTTDDTPEARDVRPAWSRGAVLIGCGVSVLMVWLVYERIHDSRVIAGDQHTIIDLTAKQKALDEKPSFELQARCGEAAKQYFIREWTDAAPGMDKDYTSHYNPDLRKCFITVKTSQTQKSGIVFTTKGVFDAVEGKTYGEYVWQSDAVKKYWEVAPIQCNGLTPDGDEVQCRSEGEFENLMSKFMDINDD